MIDPKFLAALRHRYRAELVLVLVQLEQVAPGWWLTIDELAQQLGTDRSTLNHSIRKLETLGLLRRTSISNSGGTWIWWVKQDENDTPQPDNEPAWVVRDLKRHKHERIPISQRWEWSERHGIPRPTMQGFLGGYQQVLRQRWEIVSSPFDLLSSEEAA